MKSHFKRLQWLYFQLAWMCMSATHKHGRRIKSAHILLLLSGLWKKCTVICETSCSEVIWGHTSSVPALFVSASKQWNGKFPRRPLNQWTSLNVQGKRWLVQFLWHGEKHQKKTVSKTHHHISCTFLIVHLTTDLDPCLEPNILGWVNRPWTVMNLMLKQVWEPCGAVFYSLLSDFWTVV